MISTHRDPRHSTSQARTTSTLSAAQAGRELERRDHGLGCEYLPMDVFLDPETIEAHFRQSAISARWQRVRTAPRGSGRR